MQKYMPLASFIILVIIALHVRMSFEYDGYAKQSLLTSGEK